MNSLGDIGHLVRANIRRLRQDRRFTYVELSERLKQVGRPIPVLGLRRIEHGERRVDVDDLGALSMAFGVTPMQLLEPPADCTTCRGTPPPGFVCRSCQGDDQ
jgi:transcriptional regulator with XRE-family HTH domain